MMMMVAAELCKRILCNGHEALVYQSPATLQNARSGSVNLSHYQNARQFFTRGPNCKRHNRNEEAMMITLPLEPQEEARLIAAAEARGVSADALVREALDRILAEASATPDNGSPASATGATLVAAMQASPFKEMALEAARDRLPVRDVVF
jgi:hypothetical protein